MKASASESVLANSPELEPRLLPTAGPPQHVATAFDHHLALVVGRGLGETIPPTLLQRVVEVLIEGRWTRCDFEKA